jgi:hypothetical protein
LSLIFLGSGLVAVTMKNMFYILTEAAPKKDSLLRRKTWRPRIGSLKPQQSC